jgi:hypothetical protein
MDQSFQNLIKTRAVAPEEVLAFYSKPQELLKTYA